MSNNQPLADWQKAIQSKRDDLFSRVPVAWRLESIPDALELRDSVQFPRRFMNERAYAITEILDAQTLLSKIAAGYYTAYEVTEAFCHRAAIAQQVVSSDFRLISHALLITCTAKVNCLTEIMFEDALAFAKELDEYYRTHKRTVGPLHGLPISLKDQFRVRNTNAALGLVAFIDTVDSSETESFLVKELRDLGAVLYVKTTTPAAVSVCPYRKYLLWYYSELDCWQHIDCDNNVTGQTWGPLNRFMSSGGSSGGEGALIAMHGSILGIGTDIGAWPVWDT
jgi:amidase